MLGSFERGEIEVLVGSDAMARGLDLKGVTCVINYDAPVFPATYIHRVGRTARANTPGLAISILPAAQMRQFRQMMKGRLRKSVVVLGDEGTEGLKMNEVGKIEMGGEVIEKWRNLLAESLQALRP